MDAREDADLQEWGLLDEPGEKPAPVREAERSVRLYGLGLGLAGVVATVWYWMALAKGLLFVPMGWWLLFLVGLVALFFAPPTRSARMAREVLRRWDDLQVEQALEGAGAPSDPAMQVAGDMAARVLAHPSVDEGVAQVIRRLLDALRRTARDRRTVELLRQATGAGTARGPSERTISDVLDFVSAREGQLLSALERLHRAVIMRDAEAVATLRTEAQGVLEGLEAEREVERLLARHGEGEE